MLRMALNRLRENRIHCFENVNMLIFVAAISEYDQVLFEDSTVNRLAEATMLWESVANSRWFERSSFVLMLNKTDIFAKCVSAHSHQNTFSDPLVPS